MACIYAYNVISAQLTASKAFRLFDRPSVRGLNHKPLSEGPDGANVCLDRKSVKETNRNKNKESLPPL